MTSRVTSALAALPPCDPGERPQAGEHQRVGRGLRDRRQHKEDRLTVG